MGDLRARIRARFSRANSATQSNDSHTVVSQTPAPPPLLDTPQQPASSAAQPHHREHQAVASDQLTGPADDALNRVAGPLSTPLTVDDSLTRGEDSGKRDGPLGRVHSRASDTTGNDRQQSSSTASKLSSIDETSTVESHHFAEAREPAGPAADSSAFTATGTASIVAAPDIAAADNTSALAERDRDGVVDLSPSGESQPRPSPLSPSDLGTPTPTQRLFATEGSTRHQILFSNQQTSLIHTSLGTGQAASETAHFLAPDHLSPISGNMVTRKIWVRRPGGSATLVTISEDDVVDDVRDMILRKYANSLGRQFDSPDITLRIVPREQRQERTLGPEEPMLRTVDAYFPGGQTVDEAIVVDVPLRRTPRASPRSGPPHADHLTSVYLDDAVRPSEAGTDYFGPSALAISHLPVPGAAAPNGLAHPHTISVLNTGHVPQIPSPGGTRSRGYRDRPDRPRLGRQHTSSPTILSVAAASGSHNAAAGNHTAQAGHTRGPRSRTHSNASSDLSPAGGPPPIAPPLLTPPAPEATIVQRAATPPPRVSSPRATGTRPNKKKKAIEHPTLPTGLLNGSVPPINVLIVEDNIINLKLLEAFVKRLKVRWQTAMNGREAVTKWRTGGFHLVLMDIQLPVMSGLEATREIRRLERVNSIGVFSSASSAPDVSEPPQDEMSEQDKLVNTDMFKSPVIIVALTASSLQSDRHEALAAGCNDFLTKPVNFVWLERKVMEWGCMQALIDFDGWRKWKDFSQKADESEAAKKAATRAAKTKKNRQSLNSAVTAQG